MKTIIKNIIIIITIITVIVLLQTYETHYAREVTVTNIQEQIITVQDNKGHQWSFVGNGYEIEQTISVIMYDNHTSKITDDEIIGVKS